MGTPKTPRTKAINNIEDKLNSINTKLLQIRKREGEVRLEIMKIQKERKKFETLKRELMSKEKNVLIGRIRS